VAKALSRIRAAGEAKPLSGRFAPLALRLRPLNGAAGFAR